MIQAFLDRRGFVGIVDPRGRRHTVAASSIGTLQATGPNTTYLKIRGYENLFVNCPIDQVREVVKRAKDLRQARSPQLELDFEKESDGPATNQTVAQLTQPVEEGVANGGS